MKCEIKTEEEIREKGGNGSSIEVFDDMLEYNQNAIHPFLLEEDIKV